MQVAAEFTLMRPCHVQSHGYRNITSSISELHLTDRGKNIIQASICTVLQLRRIVRDFKSESTIKTFPRLGASTNEICVTLQAAEAAEIIYKVLLASSICEPVRELVEKLSRS